MSRPLSWVAIALVCSACQGGESIRLGGSPPEAPSRLPLEFTGVEALDSLNSTFKEDNPTLTADMLLVCFTSNRPEGPGDSDIWCAEREHIEQGFGAPQEQSLLNSAAFESSAAIDLDGLTLWFGSERAGGQGGLDVYRSTRIERSAPFGMPEVVSSLNSPQDDIPRPTAQGGSVMPLASRRESDVYWTYFASQVEDKGFAQPKLVEELARPGEVIVDAQLSEDGLLLVFTRSLVDGDDPGDLFAAERLSLTEPFSEPSALKGVNSAFDDRDPWLSPDGLTLYFASDRSGDFELYRAQLVPSGSR